MESYPHHEVDNWDDGCSEIDLKVLIKEDESSLMVSPRLKMKRFVTMLIAVFIFCVGVILRFTLPPVEYFEEPFANSSSLVSNVTNIMYSAQFIL